MNKTILTLPFIFLTACATQPMEEHTTKVVDRPGHVLHTREGVPVAVSIYEQKILEEIASAPVPSSFAWAPNDIQETLTIPFKTDQHQLNGEQVSWFKNQVDFEGLKTAKISIVGYADRTGAEGYNLNLSTQRAKSVRDLLIKRGIKPENIQFSGKGVRETDDLASARVVDIEIR